MFNHSMNSSQFVLYTHRLLKYLQCAALAFMMMCSWSLAHAQGHDTENTTPVKVGIIGSGWLGGTIGKLLVKAGYDVMFSSQHLESDQQLAKQLGQHAFAGTPEQAARFGQAVILAVPYKAVPSLGKSLDHDLQGKVLLDGTNPYEGRDGAIATEALSHGAGLTTQKYFPDAKVVRVFNGVYASAIQSSAGRQSGKLGIPIAGNDPSAVKIAAQLVTAIGAEPVIVGDLASAKLFQPGGVGFGANTSASELKQLLGLH